MLSEVENENNFIILVFDFTTVTLYCFYYYLPSGTVFDFGLKGH